MTDYLKEVLGLEQDGEVLELRTGKVWLRGGEEPSRNGEDGWKEERFEEETRNLERLREAVAERAATAQARGTAEEAAQSKEKPEETDRTAARLEEEVRAGESFRDVARALKAALSAEERVELAEVAEAEAEKARRVTPLEILALQSWKKKENDLAGRGAQKAELPLLGELRRAERGAALTQSGGRRLTVALPQTESAGGAAWSAEGFDRAVERDARRYGGEFSLR